jgi:hypothetical protein
MARSAKVAPVLINGSFAGVALAKPPAGIRNLPLRLFMSLKARGAIPLFRNQLDTMRDRNLNARPLHGGQVKYSAGTPETKTTQSQSRYSAVNNNAKQKKMML